MNIVSVYIVIAFIFFIVQDVVAIDPRIVGGSAVPEGRYDYMVSLQKQFDEISHHCGGTLISSDLVLTAAHCDKGVRVIIGPYSLSNPKMESIDIERSIPHPLYRSMTNTDHDVMILKLKDESSYPFVRLNDDANVPVSEQKLRTVGRGKFNVDDTTLPDYLSYVNVTYRTNAQCSRGNYAEGDSITPDNMCAIGRNNTGTCRGDSGGPLIISGASSQADIQVGVVSFSTRNCVHVLYPDVYHRVSETYEWIRKTICSYSRNPPGDYGCDQDSILYSASPTQNPLSVMPSASQLPTFVNAPILVELKLGGKPWEIVWAIMSESSEIPLFWVQSGEYTSRFKIYFQEVNTLRPESDYYFEIFDFARDGISGEVTIYLGREPSDDMILAYRNLEDVGPFWPFRSSRIEFTTSPNNIITRPSAAPSRFSSVDPIRPTIPPGQATPSIIIMVQISIMSCSGTTGWRIESTDGQVLFERPVGSYVIDDLLDFYYSIEVVEGRDYRLVIRSVIEGGLDGEAIVFIGDELAESSIIAYYNENFASPFCFSDTFYEHTINFRASTSETIGIFPTPAPTFPNPTLSDTPTSLTSSFRPSYPKALELIRIKLIFSLQKIGWWIKDRFGEVVFEVNQEDAGNQWLSINARRLEIDYDEEYYFFLDGSCDNCDGFVQVYISTESAREKLIGKYDISPGAFTANHKFTFLVDSSGTLDITPSAPTMLPTSRPKTIKTLSSSTISVQIKVATWFFYLTLVFLGW
mmetsp:Transcript_15729/g.23153  ORF Transcript_15729/g.23153 Transcript_15729/m.23153 type:complete len:750 (+) Transcript_15729:102-2351(+)